MIALLLPLALVARSPCDDRPLPDGPLPIGFAQADFGTVRRACPRTEVGFGVGGRAIIEEESFYADIRAGSRLDGSFQPFRQLEISLSLEPLVYELLIQSFRAQHIGLGDSSVGATLLAFGRESFALSVTARASLPTSIGYYQNAFPVGLEAGLLGVIEPVEDLRLHGGLLGGASFAITSADPAERGAIIGNLGADIVVDDWLAFVVDMNGQALQRGGLDHLALGLGARFAIDDIGIEAGANVPLAGDERNLLGALLRASWRL